MCGAGAFLTLPDLIIQVPYPGLLSCDDYDDRLYTGLPFIPAAFLLWYKSIRRPPWTLILAIQQSSVIGPQGGTRR